GVFTRRDAGLRPDESEASQTRKAVTGDRVDLLGGAHAARGQLSACLRGHLGERDVGREDVEDVRGQRREESLDRSLGDEPAALATGLQLLAVDARARPAGRRAERSRPDDPYNV